MSRKPPRRRFKGSAVMLRLFGSDYLDNNMDLPTLIHTLGVQVDNDPERPDIKPDSEYRIEVIFEEIGERGKA